MYIPQTFGTIHQICRLYLLSQRLEIEILYHSYNPFFICAYSKPSAYLHTYRICYLHSLPGRFINNHRKIVRATEVGSSIRPSNPLLSEVLIRMYSQNHHPPKYTSFVKSQSLLFRQSTSIHPPDFCPLPDNSNFSPIETLRTFGFFNISCLNPSTLYHRPV